MLLTDEADLMPLALRANQDVRSIARAWRFPPDGPLTDGVRVVLIEVTPSTPAWDTAAAALDRAALFYRAGS